jgi:hypothetical protein
MEKYLEAQGQRKHDKEQDGARQVNCGEGGKEVRSGGNSVGGGAGYILSICYHIHLN